MESFVYTSFSVINLVARVIFTLGERSGEFFDRIQDLQYGHECHCSITLRFYSKRPLEQVLVYREAGTCSLLTDSYLNVYRMWNHEIHIAGDSPARDFTIRVLANTIS